MKAKKKTLKRGAEKKQKTLDDLTRDLAKLSAEFTADASLMMPIANQVRIKKPTPLYSRLTDFDEAMTVDSGSVHQVVDRSDDRLRVVHNDGVYWVPQEHVEPVAAAEQNVTWWQGKWKKLMARAEEIRKKYVDFPSARVSGFSVEIGFPPGVSIDFEFEDNQ